MENKTKNAFFGSSPLLLRGVLIVIFILGLGIRLYDLTDPPLDFHSARQLFSAVIARGMYYRNVESAPEWQRQVAIRAYENKPVIEPRIMETLVALTYRLIGQEVVWVARIYSALFWVLGGVALYALARDMTSPDGGVIAAAFYLFLPFGAIASRSFQPDSLMVMAIVFAWWAFYRWYQVPTWKTAVLAGICAGFAMFVKSVAIFMLLGGMAGLILADLGLKAAYKDKKVWTIAVLSALPVGLFMVYGLLALNMESQFSNRFFGNLLMDPSHYVRWAQEAMSIVGFSGVFIAPVGIFLLRERPQRAFLVGLWVGYFVYGLFFPYHFWTHNYYHLPLIPLVGLSFAPIAELIFRKLKSLQLSKLAYIAILGVLLVGSGLKLWDVRVTLARESFDHEPPYWLALGDLIGRDAHVVALTQDYGDRLAYYGWVNVENWPDTGLLQLRDLSGGDEISYEDVFAERTDGMDYFLVTRLSEFNRQPELQDLLYNQYAISAEGDGYILFDLNSPIQ